MSTTCEHCHRTVKATKRCTCVLGNALAAADHYVAKWHRAATLVANNQTTLQGLLDGIYAVRYLHTKDGNICEHCTDVVNVLWPCATIREMDKALKKAGIE